MEARIKAQIENKNESTYVLEIRPKILRSDRGKALLKPGVRYEEAGTTDSDNRKLIVYYIRVKLIALNTLILS